ncbi:MAG: S-methyl-5-thioribose-1-phosphate isomerase [Candidatus Micrarchaeota archaeon]
MRVLLKGKHKDVDGIWYDGELNIIDQTLLPQKLYFRKLTTAKEVAEAIKSMRVRGAPAIGIAGAYGLAIEAKRKNGNKKAILEAAKLLKGTRPTAVDLANCVDEVMKEETPSKMLDKANEIFERTISACKKIGELGEKLIAPNSTILTHCNAGALATGDWGTALSPIRFAHRAGKSIFVYVDETRPRLQGALTSWELLNEGIPHKVIADNARGYLMRKGEINFAIVGADRVCVRDGSIANKIGTYEVAVLAKENKIPFYVAAPLTTFDKISTEKDVVIEQRSEREVLEIMGKRIFPKGAHAFNPGFDITPKEYITGVICEKGVFKPGELGRLFA